MYRAGVKCTCTLTMRERGARDSAEIRLACHVEFPPHCKDYHEFSSSISRPTFHIVISLLLLIHLTRRFLEDFRAFPFRDVAYWRSAVMTNTILFCENLESTRIRWKSNRVHVSALWQAKINVQECNSVKSTCSPTPPWAWFNFTSKPTTAITVTNQKTMS